MKLGVEHYLELPYSITLRQVVDEGEKYWIAEAPELPGCKSHGVTVDDAVRNLEAAKRDWVQDSLEHGERVPVPVEREKYSGKMLLRISPSLHRALSLMAETEKLSLNQLIATILAKEVGASQSASRLEVKLEDLLDRIAGANSNRPRHPRVLPEVSGSSSLPVARIG